MNNLSDKNTFIILLCVGIFFFFVVMPYLDREKFINLLSDDTNIRKIDKNICSKQCCKHTQWPTPFNTTNPDIDPKIFKNYIGTNFSCNNGPTGGGCLCVNKTDYTYLSNHGVNIN